jgi:DNA-directed RNA polymerase II subunit RPB2
MAEYEYDQDDMDYEEDEGITAEDCWAVISAFFDSKGLVAQQLDSYDEFITSTMNDIIEDNGHIVFDQNSPPQDDDEEPIVKRRYELSFMAPKTGKVLRHQLAGSAVGRGLT